MFPKNWRSRAGRSRRKNQTATRRRFQFIRGRFETLEPRVVLDAALGAEYSSVTAAWFEQIAPERASDFHAGSQSPASGVPVSDGFADNSRWIVRLNPEATATAGSVLNAASVLDTATVTFDPLLGLGLPGLILVEANAGRDEVTAVLAASSNVAYFESDGTIGGELFPNDTQFSELVGLHNTGQAGGSSDADIDAPEAWDLTTGSDQVVVAVVDTGIDYTHPDLAANVWVNVNETPGNGIDDDKNGFIDDVHGYDFRNNDGDPIDDHRHGTHVAGTIAAVGNNGVGVSGVTWSSKVMALKFLDENNQGQTADAVRAINYATMMRNEFGVNIRVVNASWGSGEFSRALNDAISASAQAEMVFVAAAGNGDVLGRGLDNDRRPFFPASYDHDTIVAVAASGPDDRLAPFSNFGDEAVDVVAPGIGIISTEPGGTYASRNGTSMATPHVSGVAALVAAYRPTSSARDLRAAILNSVDELPSVDGRVATGGRVNAHRALLVDGIAPQFVSITSVADITTESAASQQFTVSYADNVEIDVSSLDFADLIVTRVGDENFSTGVNLVSRSHLNDGSNRSAVYEIPGPGGTWDHTDNGSYVISIVADQVADTSGNTAAARDLLTFQVNVPEPPPIERVFHVTSFEDAPDANPGDGIVDDGTGRATLRAAIMETNALPGHDTIVLQAGRYELTIPRDNTSSTSIRLTGYFDVTDDLAITGAGRDATIIDGNQLDHVLEFDGSTTAVLRDLSITGGFEAAGVSGGAINTLGNMTVDNVRLFDNETNGGGGGLRHEGDELIIRNSVFDDNYGGTGGGALFQGGGTVVIENSVFTNNVGSVNGGGFRVTGNLKLTVTDTIVSGNATNRHGAGVDIASFGSESTFVRTKIQDNIGSHMIGVGGIVKFIDSEISGATTNALATEVSNRELTLLRTWVHNNGGGGLYISAAGPVVIEDSLINNNSNTGVSVFGASAELTIRNSTITGNTGSSAGGLLVSSFADAEIINSTITRNHGNGAGHSPSGIRADQAGTVRIKNSVVADNPPGEAFYNDFDVYGDFVSDGNNYIGIVGVATGFTHGVNGDSIGTEASPIDPMLATLADNGGPLMSHQPSLGSPLIDAGDATGIAAFDQRGAARSVDGDGNGTATPDIGAVEFGTFFVDSTDDSVDANPGDGDAKDASGKRTLRAVIQEANNLPGDTIAVLPAGTYTLALTSTNEDAAVDGDLDVTGNVTISGAGKATTIIDANDIDRVFHVLGAGKLQLDDVTVEGGSVAGNGAGVLNLGDLTLNRSVLTGNDATGAGSGGAIHNSGTLTIADSVLMSNSAPVDGGGIANTAMATIQTSTLHDNSATGHGAGISNNGAGATIGLTNVTISGNVATDSGGGLFNDGSATATLNNVTIAENSTVQSGGGIVNASGTVNLSNTIVATNTATVADPDLNGAFVSSSHNLIGDLGTATGLADQANDDQVGDSSTLVDPKLGPLRDNAAVTPTHALRIGSLAIDAGDDGDAAASDQRGTTRPQDGDGDTMATSDIGAFEFSDDFAASLAGLVFFDADSDGTRDAGEEGLAGWKIFLDLNNNSTHDTGEPITTTIADDPATTTVNEAGTYQFAQVDPDGYTVVIESQAGWTQTFPSTPGTHGINLEPGEARSGVNFGQAANVGRIQGSLFHDRDSDGAIDAGEIPLDGWTVFLDQNNNDKLDLGETSLTTDASGAFDFSSLTPLTTYTLAVVDQPGWLHTDPARVFATSTAQSIATARPSRSVMTADLNGDTILDLVIANPSLGNVSVMIGVGDGTFAAPTQLADGTEPVLAAAADIDDDNDVDLIVVNRGSDDISVFRNNGSGGFTPAGKLDAGEDPVQVIAQDFTGDGVADLAILSSTAAATDNLWQYLNDGSGLFGNAQRSEIGASPTSMASGDIDGDGDADLLIARATDDQLLVMLNQGTGTFAATTPIAVGTGPSAVTVGDFNGDGRLDVATANAGSDDVSLLLNTGSGTFATAVSIAAGQQPAGIVAADFDRDGNMDLAVANITSTDAVILLNRGAATFAAPISVDAGGAIESLAFGDVDGDRDVDLLVAGSGLTNEVKLITNELSRPVFSITLGPGETVSGKTFGFRAQLGRIQGQQFHDVNGDGIKDVDDLPLEDWTVYLDRNDNGRLDTNEPSAVTDENGLYVFSDLEPNIEYTVAQIVQDGWQQTSPRSPFGFEALDDVGVGDGPHSIAAGDINGDGLQDLVVANIDSDTLTILLNSLDDGLTAALNVPTGDAPAFPALGDLDGDGDLDLAWVNQGSKDISVALNSGLGTFGGALRLAAGDTPTALTIADLDRDAKLDLAVTDGTGGVSLLLNAGNATFAAATLLLGPGADAIVTADLDGDGDRDIATVDTAGAQISFYRNNGGGGFDPPINTPVPGANPRSLAAGDVDNDGDIDLATETRILRNQGNGTLVVGNSFGAGSGARSVVLHDVDDDGNRDAVIARLLTGDIAVARGKGDGTFDAPITFSVGQEPRFVVVGDWNGDDSPDLAIANGAGDSVSILQNKQSPLHHLVTLDAGGIATDIDFGNRLVQGQGGAGAGVGTITGRSYADLNGNARFDMGEPGLPGDLVFVDFDGDGVHDIDEPSTTTLADDLGTTDVDEAGWYEFTGLPVNDYALRIVPSAGRQQTGPLNVSLTTTQYATGDGPRFVHATDLDGDTYLDLVIANATTNNISVLKNKQDGTFMPATAFGVGNQGFSPSSLSPADVTGDGKLDLLVANLYSGNVSLLQGDGSASFTPTASVAAGVMTSSLSTGDFNGDGKPDVAVTNSVSGTVSVFLNDGSGGLSAAVNYTVGEGPESIVAVDLNGDGHLDLAVAEFDSHTVSVLENAGNGTFTRTVSLPVGSGPFSVIANDINQDGHPDLVVANVLSDNVSVLVNDPSGDFFAPQQFAAGTGPSSVAAADFDADGDIDLAVTNGTSTNLSLLLNDGSGRFSAALTFGVGDFPDSLPFSVTVGDFNKDGVVDLAVAQGNFDQVSVMKNSLTPGAQHVSIREEETIGGVDFGVVIVNELPTLAAVADPAAIDEGAAAQTVDLSGISAGTAEIQLLRFAATSSNTGLMPDPMVTYTQGATDAELNFQPNGDASGSSVVTVTLTDAGPDGDFDTMIDNRSVVRSFTVTVNAVNDLPTIAAISNVSINEDARQQFVSLAGISAGGGESQPLAITASSDDTALIANPTILYTSANSTGTLQFTPTANLSGTAIITVTLTDGGLDQDLATTADNGVTLRSFTVTVSALNDEPTLDAISNIAISEDAMQQSVALTGISAGGGESQPLSVTASSNNTAIIATPAILYSSADATGTLQFTPTADASGTATITVTVTDGGLDQDLATMADNGVTVRSFTVTVNALNDLPKLDAISNVSIDEDAGEQSLALTGISAGGGESQPLRVTVTSDTTDVIATPTITYSSAEATGTLSFTAVPNASGSAVLAVTVTDGGLDGDIATEADNGSFKRSLTVTVRAVNDTPTLAAIGNLVLDEDQANSVVNLSGITAGGGESQPLRLSAISDAPGLVPTPAIDYTSPGAMGTLTLTTIANASGIAVITITATDGGLDGNLSTDADNASVQKSFTVTVNPINDIPALNPLSNVTLNEDSPQQSIDLSGISAGGGESQPLSISASSDNVVLIANPTVAYTTPDAIGSLQFTPSGDQSGIAVITVTITDGGLDQDLDTVADNGVTLQSFTVTVNAFNDAPTIDATADVPALAEDAGEQIVSLHGLSAGGGEDQPLRITATSSNQTLIPNPTIDYVTGQAVATLHFTPLNNRSGTSTMTVTVTDGGLDRDLSTANDNATIESTFVVIVNAGNDEVTLDPIGNPAAIEEDASEQVVSLTGISAGPGESQPLSVVAVSSNEALTGQLTVDYTSPNQTATLAYTPEADQSGQAIITVTVSDGGLDGDLQTDTDNASLSRKFTVTVKAGNDAPTLNPITNLTLEEDAASRVVALDGITAGGGESQMLRVSAVSNRPSLIPHPTVDYTSAEPTGGLDIQPLPNQSGEAVITVTVTDAGLDGDFDLAADNGSMSRDFTVTVAAVNDPPAINTISDIGINEDAPTQTVNLSGISAGGGESQPLSVSVTSDNPSLIPTPSIQYISPNTIGSLQFTPLQDQHGAAVITLVLSDGGLDGDISTSADNSSALQSFTVTVNSVNDAPVFDSLARISIAENAAVQRILLTGINAGGDEDQPLAFAAVSNSPELIQNPTVDYVSGEATAEISFQPIGAASGVATITLTLTDGGLDGDLTTAQDNRSTMRLLTVTVRSVNDSPTINQLADLTINEDAAEQTITLSGITAGPGESQPLRLALRADREDLLTGRALEYTSPNDTATLRFTPALHASGSVVFTATVTDGGLDGDLTTPGDNAAVERSFTVHVAPVNDPPTLNAISNLSLFENSAEQAVNFAGVTAGPGENQPLRVSVSSSNPGLLPVPTVQYSSPNASGAIRLQPSANQSGSATVTVTVTDGGLDNNLDTTADNGATEQSFIVTVAAVNLPPTLTINLDEDAAEQLVPLTDIGAGEGEDQPLLISASSDNTALIPQPVVDYSAGAASGVLRFTPASDQHGTAIIRVSITDGGLDQDLDTTDDNETVERSLTVNVASVNDPPSLAALADLQLADGDTATIPLESISAGPSEQQQLRFSVISADTTVLRTPGVTYLSPDASGVMSLQAVPGAIKTGEPVPVTVTVRLEDAGLDGDFETAEDNQLVERTLVVTVVPTNQRPTGLRLSLDSIEELPTTGVARVVGVLSADDAATDTLTFGLVAGDGDDDNDKFQIIEDRLEVRPESLLDFETQPELTIRVAATDLGGLSDIVNFKITVTDGNDWHNPNVALDVNKSGTIEPLDVLVLINWLNSNGPSSLEGVAGVPEFFLDTTDDSEVSALDVLLVINQLNGSVVGPESEASAALLLLTNDIHFKAQSAKEPKSAVADAQIAVNDTAIDTFYSSVSKGDEPQRQREPLRQSDKDNEELLDLLARDIAQDNC